MVLCCYNNVYQHFNVYDDYVNVNNVNQFVNVQFDQYVNVNQFINDDNLMIVKNPSHGAPVKRRVGLKIWQILVGETLHFPDGVGAELLAAYKFLEEVKSNGAASVVQVDGKYKCSLCEYENAVKIGVLGHIRKHGGDEKQEEVKKAEPIGDAKRRVGILEGRMMKSQEAINAMPGGTDTSYGEQFEEQKL